MNILFLYRIYPSYGGVEVVTTVLSNQFVKDGHQVCIASFEQPDMELKNHLEKSVELINLNYPVISLKNISILQQTIINKKIDLLINQWGLPYKTTILCNRAIKSTSCKLVSVLHGSPNTSKVLINAQDKVADSSGLMNIVNKLIFQVIDAIIRKSIKYNTLHNEKYILLSKAFIQPLIDYAHLKNTTMLTAIGNPITVPIYPNIKFEEKKKQLLYVGRMDMANKRVNRIIELWESLFELYLDWELVLVGDGPHKKLLMDYVSDHKIKRVRFEGFKIEPPVKYYKDASIFLLTSDLEGFGLVVTEGMSYGVVPIVYGSYKAIYDIIKDGDSGFITNQPYNKVETINCIKKLIDDPILLHRMAVRSKEESEKFTLESIKKEWYKVFNEVII